MQNGKTNIVVGLTTLLGLIGLGVLLLFFGALPLWNDAGYVVRIESPSASGIRPGTRVEFAGMDIGKIVKVRRSNTSTHTVVLEAMIREDERIPVESVVEISTPPLGGSPTVAFVIPDTVIPSGLSLPEDGTAVVPGMILPSINELSRQFRAVVTDGLLMLQDMGDSLKELTTTWTEVGRNMADLTQMRDLQAVDEGELQGNLATMLARADRTVQEIEEAFKGINAYVHDEALRQNIQQTAANARELTGKLSESVDELRVDLQQSVDELKTRYIALADDFAGAAQSLQRLMRQAEQGDGTMGRLMQDPALYNNLNHSAERLQRVLDEMRLMIEKWQKEGVPIQF